MNSEKLQQLKDEIYQEMNEFLKNSNFGKVLEKHGILEDDAFKVYCLLDPTKIQLREGDEEQQVKDSLRKISDQDIVLFDCCWRKGRCVSC